MDIRCSNNRAVVFLKIRFVSPEPCAPVPITAKLKRSLGAVNPFPSTWRGTIVIPAMAALPLLYKFSSVVFHGID